MKSGDKVILKEFGVNPFIIFSEESQSRVGKITEIISIELNLRTIRVKDETGSKFYWMRDSCDLVLDSQEYFYVGQTVYSPLFDNAERKSKVVQISTSMKCPVLCEGGYYFYLDGKRKKEDDFVSLFQEPIQFPINKPIERFEKGEIVEVSDDGKIWAITYYVGKSGNENYPYKCSSLKRGGELTDGVNYKKIRKIK